MSFDSIFGLRPAVKSLRKALENDQLAGTYLLVGSQNIGKTALALAFGQAAACLNPQIDPFDACGECDSCIRCASGNQNEIVLISPAGESTQIWQFWDRDGKPNGIVQHTISFAPTIGKRRVYIIERADTLTESAANSLLKVLEEPPPYALFVLLTPQASRMLPTIISRSQILRLQPSPITELAQYLEMRLTITPEEAMTVAAYSEGRVGSAVRLAQNPVVQQDIEKIVDLAESLVNASPLQALKLGEQIRKICGTLKAITDSESIAANEKSKDNSDEGESGAKEKVGRKQLGAVIDLLAAVYRDMLAIRLCGESAMIVHGQYRDRLEASSKKLGPEHWQEALHLFVQARRKVDQNASIGILTDWLAVRLVNL